MTTEAFYNRPGNQERPKAKADIEVEIRGLLTESAHDNLIGFLDEHATDREQDDRDTVIFKTPGRTLKVSHEINKGRAKIAIKSGDITQDMSMKETEIYINVDQFPDAIHLFSELGFQSYPLSEQKRINYKYKGSSISVKWSPDWGHHYEIDQMVDNSVDAGETEERLVEIASELGLSVLTLQEIEQIHNNINERQAKLSSIQNGS